MQGNIKLMPFNARLFIATVKLTSKLLSTNIPEGQNVNIWYNYLKMHLELPLNVNILECLISIFFAEKGSFYNGKLKNISKKIYILIIIIK